MFGGPVDTIQWCGGSPITPAQVYLLLLRLLLLPPPPFQVAFNDLVTSNTKVLQTIIGDGVRPQFPDSTPLWYVSLASRCWAGAPKSRPSFRRIVQALSALEADQAAAAGAAAARV